MGTGRQSAPTRSSLWVPPTRSSAVQPAATSGASPAGVADAASEHYAPPAHGWPAADVRSCAARPAPRSVPHVGCASCPPVRCLPSGWTIGLRCRPSPQALTLDRRARPPYLHRQRILASTRSLRSCWRAAGPTRSHGTPSAGLGLASLRGLPGTGEELGAATGAQARTGGLRVALPSLWQAVLARPH